MLALVISLLLVSPLIAQERGLTPEHKAALERLEWLAGDWKGKATIQMGPQQESHADQEEKVWKGAGGTVYVIQGLGKEEGRVIHDALAVLSWDPTEKAYRLRAYTADGRSVDADVEVNESSVIWSFKTPRGRVRYVIQQTPEGQWHEEGFFISPDGERKFFEMTLERITR
jgi:hypothetical protein